jgi:DNA-directed RNA polymerase subunit RPC12/RpoP
MSEFKFSCPGCGQHLAAADADVGRQIACPACQSAVVVPANQPSPPPVPVSTFSTRSNYVVAPQSPRPKSRNLALRFGIAVGSIVLLVLCSFVVWRIVLNHEVNTQFAKIRAAGYPTSGAELNTWRAPVPDSENGALVITQAFALFRTFPDSRSNLIFHVKTGRTNQWSAETRELVKAYLQTNGPALAKARGALLLSRFRYPLDFSYGPETLMPHLPKLKQFADMADLEAALNTGNGHPDQWPQAVEFQLKLGETLDDEPTLISHLVRSAIISTATKSAERSLNHSKPGEEACRSLQAAFTSAGGTNLLPLALVGERAVTIPIFRLSLQEANSVSQDDSNFFTPAPPKQQRFAGKPMPGLWLTGFWERDLNFYLETMDKFISLAALPAPASFALTNFSESVSIVARKRLYITSALLLPEYKIVSVKEARLQANIRLAATAFAVERFRLAKGRLPGALSELAPQFLDAVPTDPFDGEPLRYHTLPRGYVIYSVGPDGHDAGGREPPESKPSGDKTHYDITFTVER